VLEIPEWVHVWAWLRFVRDPKVMDGLPQQEVAEAMSMARFFDYLSEWKRHGSPRITHQQIQALGVNPLYEAPPF